MQGTRQYRIGPPVRRRYQREIRLNTLGALMAVIRSTARLIAAYAWAPIVRTRTGSNPSNATVTVHETRSQLPRPLSERSTTRTPRTC